MKKALVHDWYYVNGGAEKVIRSIANTWDDFDYYALVDFLNENDRKFILNGAKVQTSFIQKLPTAKNNHRKFLQLFPLAIEQFDLNQYDLIISSSASVAKGVLTHSEQLHICYCHSPMRYAWDLYHEYLDSANLKKGIKATYAKWVLHRIRQWDIISVNRVDYFIANSNFIANRIKKLYNREATVIYPPVDIQKFSLVIEKENFYFTASRMVPYKRIDLIVEAFSKMPDKKLIVIGDGPDYKKIKKIKTDNITLLGYQNQEVLVDYMQRAKGFVFAALEDFGIIPVEAQACGTPVIAYGRGGVTETVIDGKTGVFFNKQTTKSIIEAIHVFESISLDPIQIRINSERFSKNVFENSFKNFVDEKYQIFKGVKS
jgi:glycosyltransferase involved in cell wall biosynthesis